MKKILSQFSSMAMFRSPHTQHLTSPGFPSKIHLQNDNFFDNNQRLATLCYKGRIKEAFGSFVYELWSESRLFSNFDELRVISNSKVSPVTIGLFYGAKVLIIEEDLRGDNLNHKSNVIVPSDCTTRSSPKEACDVKI